MMALSDSVAGTATASTFWRDGHHPTALVHEELARRAAAALDVADAASGERTPPDAVTGGEPVLRRRSPAEGRQAPKEAQVELPLL